MYAIRSYYECPGGAYVDMHLKGSGRTAFSRNQVEMLKKNCAEHGIVYHDLQSEGHGIVHIIGPEMA